MLSDFYFYSEECSNAITKQGKKSLKKIQKKMKMYFEGKQISEVVPFGTSPKEQKAILIGTGFEEQLQITL